MLLTLCWIAHSSFLLFFRLQSYDTAVSFVTPVEGAINKGDGLLLTVEAYITKPNTPLEIIIFQPLGFNVSDKNICVV